MQDLVITGSPYPEYDKLRATHAQTQAINEFLEWAKESKGVFLLRTGEGGRFPAAVNLLSLIGEWAAIDPEKLEAERLAMLDDLRSARI